MKVLFTGHLNTINRTIVEILSKCVGSDVPTAKPEELKLNGRYDLLIADLDSFEAPPVIAVPRIVDLRISEYLIVIYYFTRKKLIRPILQAGADGYLRKDTTKDEICRIIDKVTSGKTPSFPKK